MLDVDIKNPRNPVILSLQTNVVSPGHGDADHKPSTLGRDGHFLSLVHIDFLFAVLEGPSTM